MKYRGGRKVKTVGTSSYRTTKIKKYLDYWQIFLSLTDWALTFKFVDFRRADDYNQSGDIMVDAKHKRATILLKEQETGKDSVIILHELLHLLLWQLDSCAEPNIPEKKKNQYLQRLENVVSHLERVFMELNTNKDKKG